MRVTDEQENLPAKEHATYQSGVGTLLYLTNHSRPDILQYSKRIVKNDGQTCSHPSKRNIQDHQICIRIQRLWTQVSPKKKLMVYSRLQ